MSDDFQLLWQDNGTPPNVFAFLAKHPDLDVAQRAAVLLQDQHYRWKTDTPLRVEDYLAQVPELSNESPHVWDLVVGEYQARKSRDVAPDISEYISRFPELSDRLRSSLSALDLDEEDKFRQDITRFVSTGSPAQGSTVIGVKKPAKQQTDQTQKNDEAAFTAHKDLCHCLKNW